MQTFVPEPESFRASVAVLDQQRLGKQRVETMQLVTAITGLAFPNAKEIAAGREPGVILDRGPARAWQRHPAALMWASNVMALLEYQQATCEEWTGRGYVDTCLAKTGQLVAEAIRRSDGTWSHNLPSWWGIEAVHDSHRANLVRKDPERYGALWPGVEPVEGYVWPTDV